MNCIYKYNQFKKGRKTNYLLTKTEISLYVRNMNIDTKIPKPINIKFFSNTAIAKPIKTIIEKMAIKYGFVFTGFGG